MEGQVDGSFTFLYPFDCDEAQGRWRSGGGGGSTGFMSNIRAGTLTSSVVGGWSRASGGVREHVF